MIEQFNQKETEPKVEQQLTPETHASQELDAFVNNPGLAENYSYYKR